MILKFAPISVVIVLLMTCTYSFAQVGINTTSPNGILDINSTSAGVVLPRLALTSRVVQSPATNPKSGATIIPTGTVVYNTATTTLGTNNDVTPGMYVWDGSKWIAQFPRKQHVLVRQSWTPSTTGIRTANTLTIIPNINAPTFTPVYTGYYKIKVDVNFGGGGATVPKTSGGGPSSQSNGSLNIARQTGNFVFTFDGTPYTIPASAYSTSYISGTGTNYFAIWQQFSMVIYVPMTALSTKTYGLSFTQNVGTEFVNNGSSGSGQGYVGYDIPCSVEITYMGDL